MPSLAGVRTPTPAPTTEPAMDPAPATAAAAPPVPAPGSPCTDDMLRLEVRAPASVAVGDRPTFDLVATNTAPVPCVRALDKGLQELVLLDAAGARVWGSNDCFPEASSDPRTLAPGEAVAFPVVWSGLTSQPDCAAPRVGPPPGPYVLRGRLDSKTTPDAPVTIG